MLSSWEPRRDGVRTGRKHLRLKVARGPGGLPRSPSRDERHDPEPQTGVQFPRTDVENMVQVSRRGMDTSSRPSSRYKPAVRINRHRGDPGGAPLLSAEMVSQGLHGRHGIRKGSPAGWREACRQSMKRCRPRPGCERRGEVESRPTKLPEKIGKGRTFR